MRQAHDRIKIPRAMMTAMMEGALLRDAEFAVSSFTTCEDPFSARAGTAAAEVVGAAGPAVIGKPCSSYLPVGVVPKLPVVIKKPWSS
jgi:hypothetical protein